MSNQVQVIPQFNLPAEFAEQFSDLGADDLSSGVSAGFPVMSIRGAKWRISAGGEETPIYINGTNDLAPSVKVVLLRANQNLAKTFYAGQYVEGSDTPPDCSSNDGIRPAADSPHPQCDNCAACPNNQWGSKISPSGAKIKACADVRRMAILPADDLEYSPILLRVPGASLGDLAAYGKALKQRGIPYAAVVTKLSFDPDASYPKILFAFERVLSPDEMAQVAAKMADPSIEDVLGLSFRSAPALAAPADSKFNIPANAASQAAEAGAASVQEPEAKADAPAAEPPKPKRTRAATTPAPTEAPADDPVAKAEAALAEAKAAAAAKAASNPPANTPTAAPPVAGGTMAEDIDNALASLGF